MLHFARENFLSPGGFGLYNQAIKAKGVSVYEQYGYINMADFLTYINDLELRKVLNEIISLDLNIVVDSEVILEDLKVIRDYNVALKIKRLENLIRNEVDPLEQAKLGNEIMKLKLGSE